MATEPNASWTIDPRVLLGLVGVLLLTVGFAFGYIVGSSGPSPAVANASTAPVQRASTGQTSASGHTFNGVETPPHDEAGHNKANALLAGQMCPCGGCDDLLLECSCDLATEIRGVTAHLFSRGQSASSVAQQVNEHYGLAVASSEEAGRGEAIDILEILNQ